MEHKKPRLSIVVGVLNQFELAEKTIHMMVDNLDHPEEVELIAIDNGSDENFGAYMMRDTKDPFKQLESAVCRRNEKNTGNYPMFKQGCDMAKGDVIAFLHSDVFVYEKGWDTKVLAQFDANESLGLVGFIGSTEIDNWGGRGGGTHSNMQGHTMYGETRQWFGSEAKIHGRQDRGFIIDGSVVDGCVMIFRKSVLEKIEVIETLPPHHFYDRIMSVQVIEAGYKVGILGVEFDHVSGQTANHESKWQDTSKEWFYLVRGITSPQQWAEVNAGWVNQANNPSRGKIPDQWDYCAYLEGERMFLQTYRDLKHLVPMVYGRKI